jgi:sulfocyanin
MMLLKSFAALLALAAVSTPVLAQGQATPKQPDASWLKWDAATSTTTFELIGGAPGGKSPFNFNGFVDGELVLTVPENSTVVMNFVNDDGVPHSAEIIDGKKPIPNMSEGPAIPRAYTRKALEGMSQGEKDAMRFKAAPAGEYRIFCGVPGHGISGMWIGFEVKADAKEPSMSVKAGK